MYNILTKEQLLMVVEKTVAWENSAINVIGTTLFRPISWLVGSIKQGIKKKQLTTLTMQWGIEYVKALKAFDLKEDVEQTDGVSDAPADGNVQNGAEEKQSPTEDTQPTAEPITPADAKAYAATLQAELAQITAAKNAISTMNKWIVLNNDAGLTTVKSALEKIQFQGNDETMLKVLPEITDPKKDKYNEYFHEINSFVDHLLNAENANALMNELRVNKIETFKVKLANVLSDFAGLEEIYNICISHLQNPGKPDTVKESAVNEAKGYELPTRVEDLMPAEDLMKFKSIPNIKKETLAKINFIRLDAIKYEALYIINRAKASTGKPSDKDDVPTELQKVWELGIKHVNDYFQDVIDVPTVMGKVTVNVSQDAKRVIEADQVKLDNLQKMGITETFPTGQTFDINKLYAFDCNVLGQTNKNAKTVLLMSPTKTFVEKMGDNTFYWFKLLGAYVWDEKTKKTTRVNLFENLTQNKKIINNFSNPGNSYYLAMRNIRPSNSFSAFFVYSNTGKFFFNNDIVDNVDYAAKRIETYKRDKFELTLKNIGNDANVFRIKINQRFMIDDADISLDKFPGIKLSDVNVDGGYKNAKENHDKFINLLLPK